MGDVDGGHYPDHSTKLAFGTVLDVAGGRGLVIRRDNTCKVGRLVARVVTVVLGASSSIGCAETTYIGPLGDHS